MLAFIYLTYQIIALLYEIVPIFQDTQIECLSDLGRYYIAIKDKDLRDRETQTGVICFWYSKAADKSPSVGRLYYHLAILARPNTLQQLYYYLRSLTYVQLFISAQKSILILLDPILSHSRTLYLYSLPIDTDFIRAYSILFRKLSAEGFKEALISFLSQLDNYIRRVTTKQKQQGIYITVTNIARLFNYGLQDLILRHIFQLYAKKLLRSSYTKRLLTPLDNNLSRLLSPVSLELKHFSNKKLSAQLLKLSSNFAFSRAYYLTFSTLALILRRIRDKNILPYVYILFTFLSTAVLILYVSISLYNIIPQLEIVAFLNMLLKSKRHKPLIISDLFPN